MNFIQRSLWVWVFHCIFCLYFSHIFSVSHFFLSADIFLAISLVFVHCFFSFFLFFLFSLLTRRRHATIWLRHSLCTLNIFPCVFYHSDEWNLFPSCSTSICTELQRFFIILFCHSFACVFCSPIKSAKQNKHPLPGEYHFTKANQTKTRHAVRIDGLPFVQRCSYFWQANWNGKKWTTWTLKFDDS